MVVFDESIIFLSNFASCNRQESMEVAKVNMVEQQIRPWNVLDETVLEIMQEAPREKFVPPQFKRLAYADMNIPIGDNQVMMQPKLEARMLQALAPKNHELALEIGTGTGFTAALLALLAKRVQTVELRENLATSARKNLSESQVMNVEVVQGDGAQGWETDFEPDCIWISGSLPELPDTYKEMLSVGGRLAAVIGTEPMMSAILIERLGKTSWQTFSLFETHLPALDNIPQKNTFVF